MKKYTEQELMENYQNFIRVLNSKFTGERLDKLLHMYSFEQLGGRLAVAPASMKDYFHNAYAGGYVDHLFNVLKSGMSIKILFEKMGGTIDFTDEELSFAIIHHDLGKLGDDKFEYYIPETSTWHKENQGSIFKVNPDIQFMNVPDRALYMLQHYGITTTHSEWLGIKLSNGPYDETIRSYFIQYNKDNTMKYLLPYFVHWADHIATVLEKNVWQQEG